MYRTQYSNKNWSKFRKFRKQFEDKYGQTPEGMVASADYNIKYLEDLGFTNLKVSLKTSDVQRTVEAYRRLRPMNNYAFHLGVTEVERNFIQP